MKEYQRRIKKASPKNKVEEIGDELDDKLALFRLSESDGGKQLIESLLVDVISAVDGIASGANTLAPQAIIALGVKASERLSILRGLLHAKSNVEILQGLLKQAIIAEQQETIEDVTNPRHEAMIDPNDPEVEKR